MLKVGVQGLVTGIDKWNRIALWIAQPWVKSYKFGPQVYHIEDLAALRAMPLQAVNAEMRDQTLAAYLTWDAKLQQVAGDLLPPGFLELQRLLNR